MPAWPPQEWCLSFVLALGHFLWQGTLIAVGLAIALRATKTVPVRYWLSLAALLVMAACPIVTLGWLMQPMSPVATLASLIVREEPAPSQSIQSATLVAPTGDVDDVGHDSNVPVIPPVEPLDFNTTASIPEKPPVDERSWWQKFAPQLTTAYLCGVALMLLRLVFGLWGGRRLRRRVHLIDDPSLLGALQRQATALGLKLLPVLAYCERVTVPTVVGVLKPMILLPVMLTSGLSPEQMESVLAHELAHLRRYDHLVNLLQRVIESLLFFHPALWWVSHRIRDEREHCCDDLVVACGVLPLDYAKSLLVVAELSRASAGRGSPDPACRSVAAVSLLATGNQKPSNLRQRIARLLGESATPSLRLSPRALLLAIGIPLVAVIATIQSGASNPPVESVLEFGPESNGLRCRLVAVPTTANDELPNITKSANQFVRGDDVTFAVELQNVSDKPVTLIGVRHDAKGQPRFEGKLAPEFFAPHLFELEFTDANGQPVPRTARVFLEMPHLLNGALTHAIAPGKSLVVQLRPAKFGVPMDQRLPPGSYRAKIRYRGAGEKGLAFFKEHFPNGAQAKAWSGEVTSNEVAFTVANDPAAAKPPQLEWGAAKDGLQAAVEFRPLPGAAPTNDPPGTFPTKPQVSTIFHVKNVSDRTIKFVSETGRQGDELTATDEAGETQRLESGFTTGVPIVVRWTLKPGEIAELHATSGIYLLKKPGKYTLRYNINFGNLSRNKGEGDDGFPKEDDWHQVLPTGDTPITIRARPPVVVPVSANGEIRGVLLDATTGEPVEGAKVTCEAINNPSGQRLGSSAVTDDEGRYRLHVPSPGLYNVWLYEYAKNEWMTAAADDGLLVEAGKAAASQMFLVNARKIAGTLVRKGTPVEYPVVKCNSAARPESLGVQYLHKMRTKADGSFWFAVPPGRAYLYVDEESQQTKDSSTGGFRSAYAHVEVPVTSDTAPVMLTLQPSAKKLGDTDWLKRSTPGTQIVRRDGNQHVTGTVVDESGKPIAGAKVFRDDGPIISTNEKGEFRIETIQEVQFVMHAVVPGYHVWFGTPNSGDVLKIVMEKKVSATSPPVGLEFLKPYPKLHGLSLDMTEPQFLEIVKQQELKTRKTGEGDKTAYHIGLGDGLTLIVMFRNDGTCRGIQRVRGEDEETQGSTETKASNPTEALKAMVADLSKLLPDHWRHPQLVAGRTIEMMPGMYTTSEHRPHVVLVFTDDKTRPAMRWERKDEQYEYLGETPHGHGHLFVSMKITGDAANPKVMELVDWPEATEFVKAILKGDHAKLAALRKQAERPRPAAKDFVRNGLRFELEAVAFASVNSPAGAKRKANDWWRADGTKLAAAPGNLTPLTVPKEQSHFREFVLRARIVDGDEMRRHFPGEFWIPPSPGQWLHTSQWAGPDVLKFQLMKSIEIETPATFVLYYTDEPWSVSATLDLNGKLHPNTELDAKFLALAQQFEVSIVEKLATTTVVKVHPTSDEARRTHVALSAIAVDGQTVRAIEPTAGEGFHFTLPASEFEAFQISLRRMTHKATFENVAILPGQQTEPNVTIEPLDTLVRVTFRKDGKTRGRLSEISLPQLEETLAAMQHDLNSETGELIIDTQLATTFAEAERIVTQLKASGWKWPTITLTPLKNAVRTESPPTGLEFLTPYP